MTTDRIKEIQKETGCPESVSVQQALLKVWNECEQEMLKKTDCKHPYENVYQSDTECYCELCGYDFTINENEK